MRHWMKGNRMLFAAVLAMTVLLFSQSVSAAPGDLIISEYGEGNEGNQYIEIYNGTGDEVDLSSYQVWIAFDGEEWPNEGIELDGTLENGATLVIHGSDAAEEITQVETAVEVRGLEFDGNDAIGLAKDGVLVDVVGEAENDPGTGWEVAGIENATQDRVLLRKDDSCGNTDWDDSRGTDEDDSEWIVLENEEWDNIGEHSADCEDLSDPGGPPNVRISEIRIDQPGDDDDEYFELFGTGGPELDGLTYIVLGDGSAASGSGVIENVTDLTGQSIFGQYFVAAEDTFSLGTADLTTTLGFENSDNVTHLLVTDFSGSNGDDLDTDDDGTLDVTPWGEIVDCVGLFEAAGNSDSELLYCDTVVGPNGSFVPAHVILCEDWTIGEFDPATGNDTPGDDNFCPPPPPPAAEPGDIIIHEIMQNPDAVFDENGEWFEILNVTSEDIDINGWTILDNGIDSHTIDNGGPLVVEGGALLVLGRNGDDGTNGGVEVDYVYGNEFILANGDDEVILQNSDGVIIASVEYDGGPEFPDPTGASMSLIDPEFNGADGENWCESATPISDEPGSDLGTPGLDNECDAPPPPPPPEETCGEPATLISAIQGDGMTSPLNGDQVTIEGVVTGDFQDDDGTYGDLDGFFMQEEEFDDDGDEQTSEGIFVFDDQSPGDDVAVGDIVRVVGNVEESFGLTRLTRVNFVEVCESGADLPEPIELFLPSITPEEFEAYEGMYVTFPQALVISEYFNFDRFGEIVLTSERQFQPTAVFEPGSGDAADLAEANELDRILLDDGRAGSNPDPARHPNGADFDLDNRFRGGDLVQDVVGVMSYGFGSYRIQPTAGAEYIEDNPRPEEPEDVGGDITVASFNVLNYFNTIDDGSDACGPDQNLGCRGADDEEERERQLAKIAAAMAEIGADIFGIIEVENTDGVEALEDIIEALNDLTGENYTFIETETIGTDAIKVGLIYNTATVSPVGEFAVLDEEEFTNPLFEDTPKNRPALAQTFEDGDGAILTVVVNHLKSKGSPCEGEGDQSNEPNNPAQGNCNETRTMAAEALLDWLSGDPTDSGDPDFLIIGDLNAYDKEDPIVTLIDAGYTDLISAFNGEFAYTYTFDGQLGYLDYALANDTLLSQVTGITEWHINADEPDILDYDTTFKKDAQDEIYAADPFRSSDHDPVIVGLNLTAPTPTTSMTIVKNVAVGDQSQGFNFKYFELDETFTLSHGESFGPISIEAGIYNIQEMVPAGWEMLDGNDITCLDQNGNETAIGFVATSDTFTVGGLVTEGQQVTCTFNNIQENVTTNSITIIKEVIYPADLDTDSDRDFNFFSEELGNFTLDDPITDDEDDVTHTEIFTDLEPGEYTIIENPNGNWIQSVDCTGAEAVDYLSPDVGVTIEIEAAEEVVCTFTNERVVYDLTYEKVLEDGTAALDGDWEFTLASLLNLVPGDIDQDFGIVTTIDGEGGTDTLSLPLDAYKVGEIVPDGYDLEQIDCGDDGGSSTSPPVNDQFTILLNQDLTCTFTNVEEPGTITLIKTVPAAQAAGAPGFDFVTDFIGNQNLIPTGSGSVGLPPVELAPGIYNIEEVNIPNGWYLQDIQCDSDNVTIGATDVAIDLAAGEDVVCTFYNEKRSNIIIEKDVDTDDTLMLFDFQFNDGDNPPFDFQLSESGGEDGLFDALIPGDYTITEENISAGWSLSDVSCESVTGGSNIVDVTDGVTVSLASGDDVTCTFENTKDAPPLKKVSPVLECVAPIGDTGMYRAFFGYSNPNAVTVEIPVGQNNKFNRTPQDQGQPTSFAPGRTPYFPNAAFSVDFDGSNLVWTLNGKTATASDNPVQRCNFYVTPDKEWVGADAPDNILLGLITATSAAGDLTCDWDGTDLVCNAENLKVPVSIDDQDNFVGEYSVSEDGLPEGWNILSGTGDFTVPNDNCEGKFCSHTVVNEKEVLKLERLIPDCYDVERDQYRWRVRNGNDVAIDFTLTNPAGDVIFAEGTAAPNGDTTVFTDADVTTNPTILRVDGVEQPKGRKNPNVNPCAPTTGNITVIKVIDWGQDVDEAPDTMFDFTGDIGSFTLGDGDSYTMKLPAGSYDIAEVYKYNWGVQEISCDGGDAERITRGVNVELSAGDDITCTFTNTPRCVNPRADLSAVITWDENTAMAHVTNDSDALCVWEVGMASYEKYNEVIDEQDIFDWTDGNPVPPGETIKMTIDKPACAVQVDVFIGEVLLSLDGNRYGDRLLAWQHLMQDGYCERPADKVDGYVSADGAGLDGVTVTLTNVQADSLTFETVTNMDGYYAFSDVPFGSYRIEISGDVLAGMNMAETTAMIEVSTDVQAVANFSAEQAAPTAVTLTATSTSTGSTSTMMISIIAAVLMLATLALWRRPVVQPIRNRNR